MKLHLQRSDYFNQDFEAQYRWYLNKSGVELAERYLEAVEATLNALVFSQDLADLEISRVRLCADCVHFTSERHLILI